MGHIIPGLIEDLGGECLIRTPYQDLPTASLVCKKWRDEIAGGQFVRFRKAAGVTRPLIILAQDPNLSCGQDGLKSNLATTPTYQLILSDPTSETWTRLPGLPDGVGLPVFCGLVGSVTDILVIGGWDPVTLRASSDVYIYSFLTGKWRKGADMPGVGRSFFGCAASDDDDRTVIVAGGHDEDKNALKSAMMYDVDKDEWTLLPDMARERDECKAIFHGGKFYVISGYPTDAQGCFQRSAQVLDPATWQWGPVIEDDIGVPLIGKVPDEVRRSQWMVAYEENQVLVISGSSKQVVYVLDIKSNKWSKVQVPNQFSGHVQCACVIHL